MTLPPPKACQRMRKLFAQMGSSGKDAEVARDKLNQLLIEHGLTWNDLLAILAATAAADINNDINAGAAAAVGPKVNVLDLVVALIEEHVAIPAAERVAVALWVLHTWVFDRFSITPRLALLSPVRGCGKTTLLTMIQLLVPEGNRTDSVTAAAIYYHLDRRPRTALLIDEADNLDLFRNGVLRAVFNSGHKRGGGVSRFVGGRSRTFPTFAPLAVAAIGMLPLPLLHVQS